MITIYRTKKLLSRLPVGLGEQLGSEYSNHFAANDATPTGIEEEVMELAVAQLAPLTIETTANRSVLGTLSQMVQHVQFAVEDGDVTIAEITGYCIGAWLADTPWSAKGVKDAIWAADGMADLLLLTDA